MARAVPIHVSVKSYQKEWLDEYNISPSAVLQEAIDDRLVELGFDPEKVQRLHERKNEK